MKVVLIDPSNFTLPYDNLLAQGLASSGCDVTIVKRKNRPNEKETQQPTGEFNHFYDFSESHRESLEKTRLFKAVKTVEHCWDQLTIGRILDELHADVLHFQWLVIPWLDRRMLSRVLKKYMTVITVHDTHLYHGAGNTGIQAMGWMRALREFDHTIVHTQMSYDVVTSAGTPRRDVSIVPHGTVPIGEDGLGRVEATREPAAHENKLQFLIFGYLKKYKGLETLAAALEVLPPDTLDQIQLTVAGKPHEEVLPILRRLESNLMRSVVKMDLKFLSDSELVSYLTESDVVLFAYDRIDASGALMAAIPFGKIIIASRVGVFNEMLNHDESAMLIDPGNVDQLANSITKLVQDRQYRESLQIGARKLAEEIPTWNEIGRMTRSIYSRGQA